MKEKSISIKYKEYNSEVELSEKEAELLIKANEALKKSYSPYSKFKVGSALQMKSGNIYIGSNQENASFPAGICAERSAIYHAKHREEGVIKRIAITVESSDFDVNSPIAPCGICRQVLLETELQQEEDIEIILKGSKGKIYTLSSIKDLLPLYFFEKGLKKE